MARVVHVELQSQNGATSRRRTPLSFTLHSTARIQLDRQKRIQFQVRPRVSERFYAQRCWGTQGVTKRALGLVLRRKEVHLRPAEQVPNLGYCLAVQHTSPWSERYREPTWWFIWDTTAMLSVLTITWHPLSEGRKCIIARKTALSSRLFMCQEKNSPVQTPHADLSSKTAPKPVWEAFHRNHLATVNSAHTDPSQKKEGV